MAFPSPAAATPRFALPGGLVPRPARLDPAAACAGAAGRLGPDAPRAYLERAPGVWVEAGATHPLLEQLRAPDGQVVLLRPPDEWVYLDDQPFRDVYEVLEFTVPGAPAEWTDTPPADKIT